MYRAHGLQIIPSWMPSEVPKGEQWKRPKLSEWAEFQSALVPQAVFDRWYEQGGEHASRQNMGIITGACSGYVFVVDLDDQKGPSSGAWWSGLLELHNNRIELETVQQRTGGGGRQKLFRAPADWVAPTNKTLIGVDIRGHGGFAVMPASLHETGNHYAWEAGCGPWEIPIAEAPEWLLEAIETLVEQHGGASGGRGRERTASGAEYDDFGNRKDFREEYMRDLIWAAVIGLRKDCPIPPGAIERDRVWADYERNTRSRLPQEQDQFGNAVSNAELLEREGRGFSLFCNKWRRAVRKWDGKVKEEAKKARPDSKYHDYTNSDEFAKASEQAEAQAKNAPGGLYEYLNIDQIMAMPPPVWLVDGLINEKSLGFIFGPPSSLKTFMALDISLCLTTVQKTWWNRQINHHGAVIYLCREGTSSLTLRIKAWQMHRKVQVTGAPFYLIEKNISFMSGNDVGTLLATVDAIAAGISKPITAIVVDTVSRVLPGADENLQKDMTMFIGACDMLQQRFGCVVIGVHHTNKDGGMRGSTVIPGAGDFLIETRREPGAMTGSIVIQKIKDGEDGQELGFNVVKMELAGIVPRSSLVIDPTDRPVSHESGRGWPDTAVCREILAAIDEQWKKGTPWCHASNTSRAAVPNIMNRWSLKRNVVVDILAKWVATETIEEVELSTKTRVKGYRKLAGF